MALLLIKRVGRVGVVFYKRYVTKNIPPVSRAISGRRLLRLKLARGPGIGVVILPSWGAAGCAPT